MVEHLREEVVPSPADPSESAPNTHQQGPIRLPDGIVALVLAAVSEAITKSQELAAQRLGGLTGGLKIPGLT